MLEKKVKLVMHSCLGRRSKLKKCTVKKWKLKQEDSLPSRFAWIEAGTLAVHQGHPCVPSLFQVGSESELKRLNGAHDGLTHSRGP